MFHSSDFFSAGKLSYVTIKLIVKFKNSVVSL